MSKVIPFPLLPSAFTVPHTNSLSRAAAADARTKLWVQSPSGHFMLLSGSWMFAETARLYAVRCGYRLIDTDQGLLLVEQQMTARGLPAERERLH